MAKPVIALNQIFKYLVILVILLNIPVIYFFFTYAKKNVFNTIFINHDLLFLENRNKTEKLNINEFEKIIKNLDKKSSAPSSSASSTDIIYETIVEELPEPEISDNLSHILD